MTERPFLDHARLYAQHGLRIFPCARLEKLDNGWHCTCWRGVECTTPGKHPAKPGWRDTATTDRGEIFRWWGLGGADNIGIATGAASGIVVLDVDPRHNGYETLDELEAEFGALPSTWRFLTGGGGEHILFRHPGGYVQNNANGALGSGIDIRGDGGLIIAPPSRHESGRRYKIDPEHHPDDLPLASLPEWDQARLKAARNREQRREK